MSMTSNKLDRLPADTTRQAARFIRSLSRPRYAWTIISVALIALVIFLNLGTQGHRTAGQAVRLAKVKTGGLSVEVLATGTVEPEMEFEIRSPFDMAIVAETLVKPGEKVIQGAPLIRLDSAPLVEALRRAQSAYLTASHSLAEIQNNAHSARLEQLGLAVERARKDLVFKASRLQQTEQLFRAGLVSQMEQVRAAHENELARMAVRDAELELRVAESKAHDENIASAAAEVTYRKTELEQAEARLAASVLKAPISGIVLSVPVKTGSVLRSGEVALKMADMRRFRVSALVDELEVGRLKVGLLAGIRSEYFGASDLRGTIERIVPTVRDERGVSSVQVLIEIREGGWEPPAGMNVDVLIQIDRADNVRTVPIEAVVQRRGKNAVFICEDGHARLREVIIGLRSESEVEVIQGVDDGDTVITGGHVFLQDGDEVRPESEGSSSGMKVDLFK